MKATENLENDHVYILKLCDVMEKMEQKEYGTGRFFHKLHRTDQRACEQVYSITQY